MGLVWGWDLTYVDPHGSTFDLVAGDHEWTVTQHRPGRPARVVASGPVDRLRAMLAEWADHEGGAAHVTRADG